MQWKWQVLLAIETTPKELYVNFYNYTQITGTTDWVQNSKDAIKEQCLDELQKNTTVSDDVVNQIQGKMCPNDCSGHGECVNG